MKSTQSGIQLQKETLRIETFSDGVFCIAVTLLSIEIGVEVKNNITNKDLTQSLLAQWPIYLAYVISFVNVLLAWIGHHSLFKLLRKTNSFVLVTNGLLLMLIALVPFPTRTLGVFLLSDALRTAVVFYTGYFVLISLAFRLLWYAATSGKDLLVAEIDASQVRQTTRNENIGLVCNCGILCIALVNPWIALTLSFVMWIYWFVFS